MKRLPTLISGPRVLALLGISWELRGKWLDEMSSFSMIISNETAQSDFMRMIIHYLPDLCKKVIEPKYNEGQGKGL